MVCVQTMVNQSFLFDELNEPMPKQLERCRVDGDDFIDETLDDALLDWLRLHM